MPWTDHQKALFANLVAGSTLYVAGHTAAPGSGGADELVGHGYSRGTIVGSMLVVSAAGVISLNQTIELYTPNDDSAQDVTHLSYWDALVAGNMLAYSNNTITDIDVPIDGQPVNLLAGTIINT